MHMKKWLLTAITVASVGLLAACGNQKTDKADDYRSQLAQNDTLTIGLEGTYEPFSYRKDGKLTGFEVDLGKAIAKKMHLNANIVPTKWDSLIAGVGSGKFDLALNNITPTKERRQAYLFSDTYMVTQYALITKAGSPITTLADLKEKKVADGTGTDNATVARQSGATVIPQSDFATTLQMIKQGRADATVNTTTSWYAYKKNNATDGLSMTPVSDKVQAPSKAGALIAKKNVALQKQVNAAIKALRQDGTLEKLSDKYFGANVTK